MAQTINLPGLISRISNETGASPADVRRFLHELFASIESSLEAGDAVNIDGLGEFVKGESSSSPVLFRADAAFAARLNEPFAAFEAVELNEGAEQEFGAAEFTNPEADAEFGSGENAPQPPAQPYIVLEEVADDISITPHPTLEPEQIQETELESESATEEESGPEPATEQPDTPDNEVVDTTPEIPTPPVIQSAENLQPIQNIPEVAEAEDDQLSVETQNMPATREQNRVLWFILCILIGLLIGLCGGYFAGKVMGSVSIPEDFEYSYSKENEEVESPEGTLTEQPAPDPEVTETIATIDEAQNTSAQPDKSESTSSADAASAPAPAAKQPVYDTVTQSRYLALIAKEHYGVKNYWIFIYEANPGLGNPNKIAPGTKVLVPDISTFAEESTKATTAKASRKIGELQKKYKI